MMKRTLYCTLQNRIGALERLLSALSIRGIQPDEMILTLDAEGAKHHLITHFDCADDKMMELLIKALHRQVYVLEAYQTDEAAAKAGNSYVTSLQKVLESKRSNAHASHA